jgi:peptide/nickel transport system substrate-binding protein
MNDLLVSGPDTPLFGRNFDMTQLAWFTGETTACDLFLSEQIPGDDPDKNPFLWGGINLTGYSNPEFDNACEVSLSLLPGQPAYKEAHELAQSIFSEDLPVIPLFYHTRWTASRPDFCSHGSASSAESDFPNLELYNYGEPCN